MPKKPGTPRSQAVIYARVSSKEQEKEGFSIPAQLKLLRQYATDQGFSVLQEYVDVETAKQAGRTNFTAMVEFFKKQRTLSRYEDARCIILVEKTDRLYRNFKDLVTLNDIDPEIHFVKEHNVISKDSHSHLKLMHDLKVVLAKNFIDNLSEETRKGMQEKAEQGLYPARVPLGYRNVASSNGKKGIAVDPTCAPLVQRLFEWYATGRYSLTALTEKAYEEGLRSLAGGKVPRSNIHKVLTNPLYYGEFRWKGKYYHGNYEPLIAHDLFERVQYVLGEKGLRRTRRQKHDWAFHELVSCGHCGCAFVAEIKKGRYIYYHCTGNKGKCPEKYVREEEIARQFGEALQAIHLDGEVLSWVVTALKDNHQDAKRYHDEQIATLQKQYRKLQERLDRMYIDKLDGTISHEQYERMSASFRKEQSDLLRQSEKHQQANQTYLDEGVRLLELAQRAVLLYEKQTMREKRRLLDFVCSNSKWQEGKLIPTYRKPFDLLANMNASYQATKVTSGAKSDLCPLWHPLGDSNTRPSD
jgi:site-specific DNA recombinase